MSNRRPRAPRITLEISEELIEQAVPRDSSHCLWADAVRMAYPEARRISVDLQTIRFTDVTKGVRFTYLTPRTAQVALVQFDQGIKPIPHSVMLRNGQVTLAGTQARGLAKDRSPAQKKASKAAVSKANALRKTTLRKGTSGGTVSDRVGGKTPPLGAGRRRAFGLRGLDY